MNYLIGSILSITGIILTAIISDWKLAGCMVLIKLGHLLNRHFDKEKPKNQKQLAKKAKEMAGGAKN